MGNDELRKQNLYKQIEECQKAQNSADEKTAAIIDVVADNFRKLCKIESQRDDLLAACEFTVKFGQHHEDCPHSLRNIDECDCWIGKCELAILKVERK